MLIADFFKKLFGVNRVCPSCGGRGRWQNIIDDGGGMQHTETFYCETCRGKGIVNNNDDDIDDFDLAGVGATELDDEDDF